MFNGKDRMESAIEENDAKLAKRRMAGKDGLKQQDQWTATYHGERMVGKVIVAGVALLILIWLLGAPAVVLYSAIGLAVIIVATVAWLQIRSRRRLADQREQQLREHRARKQAESTGE